MNDFHEAVLTLQVTNSLAGAYKKAIEDENSRYWVENEITDKDGNILRKEQKPIWNGNHVHVDIDQSVLRIGMISHTLPNLKQSVEWYEKQGATVVYKSWDDYYIHTGKISEVDLREE